MQCHGSTWATLLHKRSELQVAVAEGRLTEKGHRGHGQRVALTVSCSQFLVTSLVRIWHQPEMGRLKAWLAHYEHTLGLRYKRPLSGYANVRKGVVCRPSRLDATSQIVCSEFRRQLLATRLRKLTPLLYIISGVADHFRPTTFSFRCPLCGSTAYDHIFLKWPDGTIRQLQTSQCGGCSVVFKDPIKFTEQQAVEGLERLSGPPRPKGSA